jgi:hypothetical protein
MIIARKGSLELTLLVSWATILAGFSGALSLGVTLAKDYPKIKEGIQAVKVDMDRLRDATNKKIDKFLKETKKTYKAFVEKVKNLGRRLGLTEPRPKTT